MGALDGKVAIITGAAQGVGRCHAEFFAAQGASVVVNDISDAAQEVAESINASGGTALAHQCSVTDWDAVGDMVQATIERFGDVDIVVNNAGFLSDAMIFSMTEEQYDPVVEVHLKGHVALIHHVSTHWRSVAKALGEGEPPRPRRVINTTSESGLFGAPGQSNYGSAKGGIVTLTYIAAKELARYGVTVNCVAPRARTPMTEKNPRFTPPASGFDPYDPGHVSPMIAWLASDAAEDVNGQVFILTGDEIHRMAQPRVAATITAGDQRWTLEAITDHRNALFGDDGSVLSVWAGPPVR